MLGVTIFTIIAGEFVVNGLAILIAKTLGTTLSVLGILDRFVDLLTVLGVMLPPIIGIMLVDYYLLRGSRKILDDSQLTGKLPDETVTIGWTAICASIVGGIVGLVTEWGGYRPSTHCWLAILLYWALKLVFSRSQKSAITLDPL